MKNKKYSWWSFLDYPSEINEDLTKRQVLKGWIKWHIIVLIISLMTINYEDELWWIGLPLINMFAIIPGFFFVFGFLTIQYDIKKWNQHVKEKRKEQKTNKL